MAGNGNERQILTLTADEMLSSGKFQLYLLTAAYSNSASSSSSTLFSTSVIHSRRFDNPNRRFSSSPPPSPSLDCIRCSISQSHAMEIKPETRKNDEVPNSLNFLSVRPYVPPSWASHLNPIPTRFSSLGHVSSHFRIPFPACIFLGLSQ